MGRKFNTFTVEEALKLFARAGNDDQRREILERLTFERLREFAGLNGIKIKYRDTKTVAINLIMKELPLIAAEPETREPEQQRQEVRETAAERKARLEQEMREREAAAAAAKLKVLQDIQIDDLPLNQLRQLAGVSQAEVARAIRCNLDDYLNVEYWGRGKGVSRLIAAKARKYLTDCIRRRYT